MSLINEEKKSYSTEELTSIREGGKIELLTKFNQIEILRILHKDENNMLNENKYGIHVNLTEISPDVIEKLQIYLNYVTTQESTLDEIQKQQDNLKNIFMSNNNE